MSVLEIREVNLDEAMSKQQIIRHIAKEQDMKYEDVRRVCDSLADLFQDQVLTVGAWNYPGMPTVTRKVLKERVAKDVQSKRRVLRPATCQLSAKIPDVVKRTHQDVFKVVNEKSGNTPKYVD